MTKCITWRCLSSLCWHLFCIMLPLSRVRADLASCWLLASCTSFSSVAWIWCWSLTLSLQWKSRWWNAPKAPQVRNHINQHKQCALLRSFGLIVHKQWAHFTIEDLGWWCYGMSPCVTVDWILYFPNVSLSPHIATKSCVWFNKYELATMSCSKMVLCIGDILCCNNCYAHRVTHLFSKLWVMTTSCRRST